MLDPEKMEVILATDCGSTTTKARLFRRIGDEYRFVCTGEAPTTVEAPYEDVTMGVRNAVREVEELSGTRLLSTTERIQIRQSQQGEGCDLYVTTSSAGGGLQMMVFGVTKSITAESAERAALGGGAIVMGIVTVDDAQPLYQKVQRVRFLRPDMVLMAGGTDGGSVDRVVSTAEILRVAEPKARFGEAFSLPVIYAGNKNARNTIEKTLDGRFALDIVDNLRPTVDLENTDPARDAIQRLFMEHVMSHAPGYDKLMTWTEVPIMPTPAGEGMMFRLAAEVYNKQVIGVGLGGATTNIYSVYEGKFVRSVSANLGMSYSICNVLKSAGVENVTRWIPFEIDIRDRLGNKMIRPTTIPQTLDDLVIEHAVAREALRLGFEHHKLLARPLLGVTRSQEELFKRMLDREEYGKTYIDMMHIDWIGGTGGLLSHAPDRVQSALMLIDGFRPEGVTELAQDSVFMMPHLGVLSTVHRKAAMDVFEKDCVVHLGTCIAFRGNLSPVKREKIADLRFELADGRVIDHEAMFSTLTRIPLGGGESATVTINPIRGFDVGPGSGRSWTGVITGGVAGVIIDARGRPLEFPTDAVEKRRLLLEWLTAVEAYPPEYLARYAEAAQ
jgi:uncharacterized protein (TIGR01319 family)